MKSIFTLLLAVNLSLTSFALAVSVQSGDLVVVLDKQSSSEFLGSRRWFMEDSLGNQYGDSVYYGKVDELINSNESIEIVDSLCIDGFVLSIESICEFIFESECEYEVFELKDRSRRVKTKFRITNLGNYALGCDLLRVELINKKKKSVITSFEYVYGLCS